MPMPHPAAIAALEDRLKRFRIDLPAFEHLAKAAAQSLTAAERDGEDVAEFRTAYAHSLQALRFVRRELRDAEYMLDELVASGSKAAVSELHQAWTGTRVRRERAQAATA